MNYHTPTGDDIAKLLLLCAPSDVLKELGLSEENRHEFVEDFNLLRDFDKTRNAAYALYHANRTIDNFNKSRSIISTLYFSPEVIHSLVQLVEAEVFSETDNLKNEIEKDNRSKKAIKAINTRHNQPGGSREKRDKIRAVWASGKYSSRDICAEEEYATLGYTSFSAARKALRNTKDPT